MAEFTELERIESKKVIGVGAARAVATLAIWIAVGWSGNVIVALLAVVATMTVWAYGWPRSGAPRAM